MTEIIWRYINPGRPTPIREVLALQEELFRQKKEGDRRNYILFAEHEPVYTYPPRVAGELDRLCRGDTMLLPAPLHEMPEQRGGSITFHGPGQLVCYFICDLPGEVFGVFGLKKFLDVIDDALIATLELLGIRSRKKPAGLSPAAEGIWVIESGVPKKIASHGMCARRTLVSQKDPVTKYGCALNIRTDLSYFDYIYPCGCDIQITSMQTHTGEGYCMREVAKTLKRSVVNRLMDVLEY